MTVHWEQLYSDTSDLFMYRAKIPGRWLIYVGDVGAGETGGGGVVFYPDPNHKWDGNSLP
jgi:hypothetical protein